jgi:signal transduction histidine kinase
VISARAARRATWVCWVFTAGLVLGGLTLALMNRSAMDLNTASLYVVFGLAALSFSTVGGLVARRNASNPIGWLFCLMGLAFAALPFSQEYAIRGRYLSPGSLPAADWFGFATDWLILVLLGPIALVFLLFPAGHPLSPRWRTAVWAAGLSGGLFAVTDFLSQSTANGTGGDRLTKHGGRVPNPIGILPANAVAGTVIGLTLFVATIAGVVSLILRLRRARGVERQQVRWLAYAGAAAVVLIPLLPLSVALNNNVLGNVFWYGITSVLALGIPIASGIAILKYRLYDLDVVVKKTVVFGALAAFATLVYLAVVVGIGAAIGSKGNGALTLAAAAIVAIAFQPLRTRARHLADRLVYGARATPYEVLSEFSDRMGAGFSTEDALPRMAKILGQGTGAEQARVWLRFGPLLRPAAAWPEERDGGAVASVEADELDRLPGAGKTFPVSHQGELLGALTVTMPPSDPLTPSQERLIGDLASQAGLVLRNVRLIEELRASRQRLVAAQDEERRRLERNLHDGAQQQLVALGVQLGLTQRLAAKDAPQVAEMLGALQSQVSSALDDLRDLARGIYPPLLADRGLLAALEAQARKSPVPVDVLADGVGRFSQEIEAAVYFSCLEAIQNVAKYAAASRAVVRLGTDRGELTFQIEDNGTGFDPVSIGYGTGLQGMADRVDALGGSLEVDSAPGYGTRVTGRIPIREIEPVT